MINYKENNLRKLNGIFDFMKIYVRLQKEIVYIIYLKKIVKNHKIDI